MSSHTLRMGPLLKASEVFHFATVAAPAALSVEHDHRFHEIFWVFLGQGLERVDGVACRLHPGILALVRPEDRHAFEAEPDAVLTFRNLAFPSAAWRRVRRRYGPDFADPFALLEPGRRRLDVGAAGIRQLESVLPAVHAGRRDALTLDHLLLTVCQTLDAAHTAAAPRGCAWLHAAVADAATLRQGVDALVEACGHSHEHVTRTCRRQLGCTPTELVNRARLEHAAQLLQETSLTTTEVCYHCGFNNLGHFHARFKRMYGRTPRSFRLRAWRVLP